MSCQQLDAAFRKLDVKQEETGHGEDFEQFMEVAIDSECE